MRRVWGAQHAPVCLTGILPCVRALSLAVSPSLVLRGCLMPRARAIFAGAAPKSVAFITRTHFDQDSSPACQYAFHRAPSASLLQASSPVLLEWPRRPSLCLCPFVLHTPPSLLLPMCSPPNKVAHLEKRRRWSHVSLRMRASKGLTAEMLVCDFGVRLRRGAKRGRAGVDRLCKAPAESLLIDRVGWLGRGLCWRREVERGMR